MNLDEIVSIRKSIRKFADKKVPRELINSCLEVARLAPSACNSQPWHFVVLDDEDVKNKFCDEVFSGIYLPCKFFKKAPVIIALCAEVKANIAVLAGQIVSGKRFYQIDQAIAGEHLALKATDLGLGTCWIGWFDENKAKQFLHTPKNIEINILFALGYPEEEQKPIQHNRKTLQEISSYNTYK